MNVVDSCAWLEFFADGPNAKSFLAPLKRPSELIVPSITILEVFKRMAQQRGEDAALSVAAFMSEGQVIPLDDSIAIAAAKLGIELSLPLADSVILATARAFGAVLWTQDRHFQGIDGVRYIERAE
jgi:predicted nucleic acid-binding protein